MSKVSVIVPIYNAGNRLHKCIKSILGQTFKDFELILINDGSTDNSLYICKKYQSIDNRIIVIDKKNEGSIATRKKGLEASSSEYIMFIDADDWVDKRIIKILFNESIESGVDITVCNTYKVLGNGSLLKKKNNSVYFDKTKIYNQEEIKRNLLIAYFYGHPFPSSLYAKLYKKEILKTSGKYLKRIHFYGDDLYYNLEIFLKANTVKVIDKSLYYYRLGGFSGKYVQYLFEDMVNGYQIQKEVIDEYYQETRQKQYNGISIMLLNTLKTCLHHLFSRNLNEKEMKNLISSYVNNDCIIESINNDSAKRYFSNEYLEAIKSENVDYLYQLGGSFYKKNRPKKVIMNVLSKLSVI